MKKSIIAFFVATAALICGAKAQAQNTNTYFKKGYTFDIELSVANNFDESAFTTSHGYSFGNGLFIGGGLGFEYVRSDAAYMTPVFAELKWSWFDFIASPYVDARVGYMVTNNNHNSFYFSPSVGLDVSKVSLFVGWDIIPSYNGGFKFGVGLHF